MWDKNGIVVCMVNGWNMCVYVYKSGIVGQWCIAQLCMDIVYTWIMLYTHVLYVCMVMHKSALYMYPANVCITCV